ncbi:MAG TPA: diguanylate cyclase [Solirubrobacteraceae bacterium]|jgi:diguanylate cyclase (GGDEF)-like protein/putative nucleotidyltransferase with HDIG domain|nr:diguanylate cyclase [Solirubrobacteraceae bacterium]
MSALSQGDGRDDIWGGSFVGSSLQASLVAKVLATLFAAGATLAALTVVLPHPERANELGLLAIIACAYSTAAALYTQASRLPAWTLHLTLAWGSTLITSAAYFSGEAPSPLVFFYLWVFLYSSYFFTHRQTAVQIVYVGLAYGTLLVTTAPLGAISAWWLVGMGTLLVGAMVIMVMRARVELLIARLYDAARTDPLTKLSNRRGFRELLDLELERARRSGSAMGVLVGDLDDFKDINDRSGHHVGDLALQRVARLLREGKHQIDAAARVGGEEFALIVPDTEHDDAYALAERLRQAVREEFAEDPTPLTISFGLSLYPEHAETAASLLHAADEALYAAKESGRNRTVRHSPILRLAQRMPSDVHDIQGERFVIAVLDMAEAVDLRFSGSARHSETVGRYAEMMARELGLPEWRISRIRLAGILHDIGKAGVPNSILRKPGPLTPEEYELVKRHPELGAQMIEHISLSDVREWVAAHHERPDGLGYPLGLNAGAIPLEARIVAVADAYEAMTSDRPYRDSIGYNAALAELRHGAGTQFDAMVVEALIAVLTRDARRAGESFAASA